MDDWRIKYEAQEIARAIAAMIAEQRAHGASDDDIAALVKLMGDDQESEAENSRRCTAEGGAMITTSNPGVDFLGEGRRPRPVV